MISAFNRFDIQMTLADAKSASHQGACDASVSALIKSKRVSRPKNCTPESLAAELKEFGAWEADIKSWNGTFSSRLGFGYCLFSPNGLIGYAFNLN